MTKYKFFIVSLLIIIPSIVLSIFSFIAIKSFHRKAYNEAYKIVYNSAKEFEFEIKGLLPKIENLLNKISDLVEYNVRNEDYLYKRRFIEFANNNPFVKGIILAKEGEGIVYPIIINDLRLPPDSLLLDYDKFIGSRNINVGIELYKALIRNDWRLNYKNNRTWKKRVLKELKKLGIDKSEILKLKQSDKSFSLFYKNKEKWLKKVNEYVESDFKHSINKIKYHNIDFEKHTRIVAFNFINTSPRKLVYIELDNTSILSEIEYKINRIKKNAPYKLNISKNNKNINSNSIHASIKFDASFPLYSLFSSINVSIANQEEITKEYQSMTMLLQGVIVSLIILVVIGILWTFTMVNKEVEMAKLTSNFVSNVSHELKTPLSVLLLASEKLYLDRVKDENSRKEYYKMMLGEGQRLKRLIENVLDFSRITRGKKRFYFSKNDIKAVVSDVIGVLKTRIEKENVNLVVEYDDNLPLVNIDRDAIIQALVNIIDNAIKYSGENKKILVKVNKKDDKIAISVKDNGIGINEDDIKNIFEKFYQAGDALKSEVKGVGLGLAIVNHIITAHKGEIKVTSKPGKGSEFTILLPIYG